MKFSLLHPSRARYHKSINTVGKWIEKSIKRDFEVIISIDESDPYKEQYRRQYTTGRFDNPNVRLIVNSNRSAVEAINNAAKVSEGEILIVVSDDTDAIHGWDKIISEAIGTHKDFVLKVYDGIQDWIVTMPIMDRAYYERFGYVYHPDYKHMFCDTHLTHVADALQRLIIRNDIVIPHLHHSLNKSPKDELTKRIENTFNEGKSVYLRLLRQNFQLDSSVNIWRLSKQARTHLNWLQNVMK